MCLCSYDTVWYGVGHNYCTRTIRLMFRSIDECRRQIHFVISIKQHSGWFVSLKSNGPKVDRMRWIPFPIRPYGSMRLFIAVRMLREWPSNSFLLIAFYLSTHSFSTPLPSSVLCFAITVWCCASVEIVHIQGRLVWRCVPSSKLTCTNLTWDLRFVFHWS